MKDIYTIPKRTYPLLPDYAREEKQNTRARWFFFVLGLLLLSYMVYYAHAQDKALKIMNPDSGGATPVTLNCMQGAVTEDDCYFTEGGIL